MERLAMLAYIAAALAALALVRPDVPELDSFYTLAASPIGEVAAVVALALAAAEIAGRYLWPVRNR